jgi:hypothetical protein
VTGTWRVQWFSRPDVDSPDRAQGRIDFDNEPAARACYASEETQSRVGAYWRVELHYRPAWQTVEVGAFGEEKP